MHGGQSKEQFRDRLLKDVASEYEDDDEFEEQLSVSSYNKDSSVLFYYADSDISESDMSDMSESEEWTDKVGPIGEPVSQLFGDQWFTGKVVRYLPESSKGAMNQLYHILWEDGDECDYDYVELREGIFNMYNNL